MYWIYDHWLITSIVVILFGLFIGFLTNNGDDPPQVEL